MAFSVLPTKEEIVEVAEQVVDFLVAEQSVDVHVPQMRARYRGGDSAVACVRWWMSQRLLSWRKSLAAVQEVARLVPQERVQRIEEPNVEVPVPQITEGVVDECSKKICEQIVDVSVPQVDVQDITIAERLQQRIVERSVDAPVPPGKEVIVAVLQFTPQDCHRLNDRHTSL